MNKKSIRDLDVAGKRVLVRADFTVPTDAAGAITDDSRIREALPTIRYLLDRRARVILCSHFGRPKGPDPKLSLRPVARRLEELAGRPVKLVADYEGGARDAVWSGVPKDAILMLENVRFHPEEERNDPAFARALAALADLYVNDAFGTAHRAHASTEGVAHYLPAVAGLMMERELHFLNGALLNPARPCAAVVGGAKVSDKGALVERMVELVDAVLIGGGMCATFFKARGYAAGASLAEPEMASRASAIEARAKARGVELYVPVDVVVAERFAADAPARTAAASAVPAGWVIMDIGPQTVARFAQELGRCKTVVWNGPMGVFEMPRFAAGTKGVAQAIAALDAVKIVGGGSTAEAVHQLGLAGRMTHVSTGGGALLELLEGRTLPGVAALLDK
jgi:phosphoglycerate kinase